MPFLSDGLAVEGLDASAEMLAICRSKAAQVGVTPTLYQQPMQDVDLPTRYRTVFIRRARFRFWPSVTKRSRRYDAFIGISNRVGNSSSPWRCPGATLGSSGSGGCDVQGCAPLMGLPFLSTRPQSPIASNRCSTFGCVTRSSKTGSWRRLNCARIGCGGTTDTSSP